MSDQSYTVVMFIQELSYSLQLKQQFEHIFIEIENNNQQIQKNSLKQERLPIEVSLSDQQLGDVLTLKVVDDEQAVQGVLNANIAALLDIFNTHGGGGTAHNGFAQTWVKLSNVSDNFDDKLKLGLKVEKELSQVKPLNYDTEKINNELKQVNLKQDQLNKDHQEIKDFQKQIDKLKKNIYSLSLEEFSNDQILVFKKELNEVYDYNDQIQIDAEDQYQKQQAINKFQTKVQKLEQEINRVRRLNQAKQLEQNMRSNEHNAYSNNDNLDSRNAYQTSHFKQNTVSSQQNSNDRNQILLKNQQLQQQQYEEQQLILQQQQEEAQKLKMELQQHKQQHQIQLQKNQQMQEQIEQQRLELLKKDKHNINIKQQYKQQEIDDLDEHMKERYLSRYRKEREEHKQLQTEHIERSTSDQAWKGDLLSIRAYLQHLLDNQPIQPPVTHTQQAKQVIQQIQALAHSNYHKYHTYNNNNNNYNNYNNNNNNNNNTYNNQYTPNTSQHPHSYSHQQRHSYSQHSQPHNSQLSPNRQHLTEQELQDQRDLEMKQNLATLNKISNQQQQKINYKVCNGQILIMKGGGYMTFDQFLHRHQRVTSKMQRTYSQKKSHQEKYFQESPTNQANLYAFSQKLRAKNQFDNKVQTVTPAHSAKKLLFK